MSEIIEYDESKEVREEKEAEDKKQEALAKVAHARKERILSYKRASGKTLVLLGKELYEAKSNQDWQSLGHESWASLVAAENGYGLNLDTDSKLRKIYDHYVLGGIATLQQLQNIAEPFKLYEARNYIQDKKEFDNISLPLSQIRATKEGVSEADCEHDWRPIWKCQKCRAVTYALPPRLHWPQNPDK